MNILNFNIMPNKPERRKRPWKPERKPYQSIKAYQDFYNSPEWRKVSKEYREKNPYCVRCKQEGVNTRAEVTDHIKRLRAGGARFDYSNLQSLCRKHHNQKSGLESKGYREK